MFPYNYKYPHSNMHELDLDWIIRTVKKAEQIVDDFSVFNKIIWAGTWNAAKSYTAWNIVQDNEGNGYIAIKAVPANVNLTNTDYWVLIAEYDALYAAFNQRILDLESDMTTLSDDVTAVQDDITTIQGDITTLSDDITTVQGDITTIQGDITTIQGDITDINADIDKLENPTRRFIVISDSYGLGRGGATGWTSILEGFLDPGADNWYTWSEGSMSVYHVGDNGHNAEGLLAAHAADITDPDTITDIVFGLGINDESDTVSNIDAAFRSLVAYCEATYPKAKIWFGNIGNRFGKTVSETYTYIDHLRLFEQLSGELGVSYITGVEYIMHNRSICQADNVHPTTEGATQIAKYVNGALHGMVGTYTASRVSTLTAGGNSVSCPQMINGPISTIQVPAINNTGTFTFSGGTAVTFGTFANWLIDFNSYAEASVNIFSSDTNAPEAVTVIINDNTLYIKHAVSGSLSVTGIQLDGFCLTVPTLWC